MVISKNAGKRKKKEIATATEPATELPKRTKVHAQRKFAQGQGQSSSSSLSLTAASQSQQTTPVKDSQPSELLPNLRPNTEDFLTFLCFRGTSVLPSHLDYLNTNKKTPVIVDTTENSNKSATNFDKFEEINKGEEAAGSSKDKLSKSLPVSLLSNNANVEVKSEEQQIVKPPFIPFAVRKHAETVIEGKRRQTVQALKKKYQEQRMAKSKLKSIAARPTVQGRKTRSAKRIEDDAQKASIETELKDSMEKDTTSPIKKETQTEKKQMEKEVAKTESALDAQNSRKTSLRNSGFVEPADKVQKIEKPTKSSNRVQSNTVVGAVKPISVQLPVQTETKKADDKLQNSFSPKTRRGRAKKETISEDMPQNKTKKETATKTEVLQKQPSRVTRQKSLNLSHQIEDENEKNTMKLTEKLSVNESQTDKTNENAKDPNVSNVSLPIKRIKKEEEFSSDDDEPLAKAIKKSPSDISIRQTNRRKNKKGFTHTKNTAKEIKDEISIVSEKSTKSNEALSKRKRTDKDKPRKQISKRGQSPKLNPLEVDNISNIESTPNLNSSDTNLPKFKKAIDQRKRKSDMTDLFPLDQSENEARTSRPMRKTKTAAAIYMELIGQKLNLGEFDDDNYSMDSFPELPNVRKTEQMENELKANIGKEKGKLVKARKKAQSKKIDDPDHGNTEEKMTAKKKQKAKKVDEIIPVKEGNVKDEVINATANITSAITITATIPTTATITTTTTAITTNTVATNVKKKRYSKKADVDTAESLVLLAQGGSPKKLEKSFSDSDDEPLAVKATKKSQKLKNARRSKDESSEAKVVILSSELVIDKMETKSEIKSDDKETLKNQLPDIEAIRRPKIESIKLDVIPHPKAPDQFTKPIEKEVIVSTSRPYQENALQLLSPTINLSPMKSNKEDAKIITPFKSAESNSPAAKSNTSQAISSILANLMPSKEESGKIFGIASVSLAQSSGPNDTKCTLGKCGSIHKPSLGPVVPTETFLLNDQMSSKERRKAKVNMTHEQIQKWLTECSDKAEYPEEDFLDDDIDLSTPPKPINYMITPSPFRELIEKDSASTSTRLSKPKSTPSMREKLSSIPKGPSLKAKPVVLKEDRRNDTNESTFDTFPENKVGDEKSKNVRQSLADNISKEVINQLKFADKPKESRSERQPFISKDLKQRSASPQPEPSNTIEDLSKKNKVSHSKPAATSSKTAHTPTSVKSTIPALDKKPIYNQKRTPVYNTKIVETTTKPKPVVNSFGAFSPENEPSIYSFDKEEDNIPTSTPFRRHSRRESSSTSKIDDTDRLSKKGDMSIKPDKSTESTPKKTVSQQQAVSLTLSPEDNSKSASIAVQVSMDVASLPKPKSSGDGNDSDSEGHTFYIPLQGTNVTGSKSDQLIQGVAVKLGTEGPEGPNQRVIMHAKLVTKAQMGSNTTPIPEAMANVHEIVKSLIACKESSSKSVPVGTVQPRFKSSGDVAATSSTSLQSSVAQQQSGSGVSRQSVSKQRYKYECTIKPSNNTVFPRHDDPAQMVEALTFRPTDKEFHDPIEFIERITPVAARFGLCRIIPPASFKPECNISDDMRFRAYNLYVHKMLHRWGPSAKEFSAIRKYLATQRITLTHPPWIGGMEVDLPRLYHTVQELGGLKEVIEKKKWPRVAEEMCIPKSAQDRVTKLDDIYCKYLLPYDTLSPAERQKLFDEVEADWAKAEAKARRNADRSALNDEEDEESEEDDDEEVDNSSMECIVKGRNMPLSAFFRIARNTMALWFKNTEPTSSEVETEFWRHVAVRDSHVCVHSGSIDSSGRGYGFPAAGNKAKAGAKHPWNLKVLTNNQGSILRSIGPVTGVTVPTLHVGMLFSACCWYRDPHGLPWIEYLHTGGSKIWYGVPDEQSANFRAAFTSLVPTHCQNKTVWLPCDTAMVPPHMLTDRGVSLCRTEQEPGQFVIVFPRAYTSSLCTGYSISESVYFATNSWLNAAEEDFKDIHDSCEPAMFSLEQLLFAVASDIRTNSETLAIVLPMITKVYEREIIDREKIKAAGVAKFEMVPVKDSKNSVTDDFECDTCRANLYISWIKTEDDNIYCLQHGLKYLTSKQIQAKDCKLITTFTIEDIAFLINKIKEKGEQQPQQTSRKLSLKKQQTLGGSK